jgi:hypothetical protein
MDKVTTALFTGFATMVSGLILISRPSELGSLAAWLDAVWGPLLQGVAMALASLGYQAKNGAGKVS